MSRRVALLIDGGFFLKRLPRLVAAHHCDTAEQVTNAIRVMCRQHVQLLTGAPKDRWIDQVYRIFFYDAVPYDGSGHHPLENRLIDFGKSETARFRLELFDCLRRQRKVALRLGKVNRESDWSPPAEKVRRVLGSKAWFQGIDFNAIAGGGDLKLTADQVAQAQRLQQRWSQIAPHEVRLGLRQKGVDMRIGLDIASITLKKQADTIVLVAGDSDFVPAAKLARREGVEFVLDPMWQKVNADLFEHIDGLQSGLPKPKAKPVAQPVGAHDPLPEES
jgi:uncharacterized LabA/DUF88 family protein